MSTCTINTTLKECNIVPWDFNLFIERDKTELYYVTIKLSVELILIYSLKYRYTLLITL